MEGLTLYNILTDKTQDCTRAQQVLIRPTNVEINTINVLLTCLSAHPVPPHAGRHLSHDHFQDTLPHPDPLCSHHHLAIIVFFFLFFFSQSQGPSGRKSIFVYAYICNTWHWDRIPHGLRYGYIILLLPQKCWPQTQWLNKVISLCSHICGLSRGN